MSDNLQNKGNQDRQRINVNEEHEVRYWTEKFGVTPERLKEAVSKAGVMAKDVEKELGGEG